MKIISITAIKNEADIIESFVRYHMNVVDMMIILNNGSTDDTNYILESLIEEGLPVVVIQDEDKYFEPKIKYNMMLKKAFDEYNADIVCPLDCDEFITCPSGNPRDIIEKIDPHTCLEVRWKTYVPTFEDNENIKFIPSRITHVRDESIEFLNKAIMPKELYYDFNAELDIGNHHILFDKQYKDEINVRINDTELNIAHFPLRSIEQTKSKVLVNYPNTLSRKFRKKGASHHYVILFNKVKNNQDITIDDVHLFAKYYSMRENKGRDEFADIKIDVKHDPMNLTFCENIELKYPFDESPIKNVLENYVYFAEEIHKFKNEIEAEQIENAELKESIEVIEADKKESEEELGKYKSENETLKNDLESTKKEADEKISKYEDDLKNKTQEIEILNKKDVEQTNEIESLEKQNKESSEKLKLKENEVDYLKSKDNLTNKLLSPFAYAVILVKSKPKDISKNIKLYKSLKNNENFDVGYYLQKYPKVKESKIFNMFSAELHYTCVGLDHGLKINENTPKIENREKLLEMID